MLLLPGLATIVAALSGGMMVEALQSRRQVGRLDEQEPGETAQLPRVSIIEEAKLAAAAQSLMAQDYPDLEIVLVDDRSGDRTGGSWTTWLVKTHVFASCTYVGERPPPASPPWRS